MDKPNKIKNDDYLDNLYKEISQDKDRETILVYHIADLHVDLTYTEGAMKKDCGEIVCCKGHSMAKNRSEGAGKWGDYACDLPFYTLELIPKVTEETGNPDFIIWTGDNNSHDIH
jgi:hypothetical protein